MKVYQLKYRSAYFPHAGMALVGAGILIWGCFRGQPGLLIHGILICLGIGYYLMRTNIVRSIAVDGRYVIIAYDYLFKNRRVEIARTDISCKRGTIRSYSTQPKEVLTISVHNKKKFELDRDSFMPATDFTELATILEHPDGLPG